MPSQLRSSLGPYRWQLAVIVCAVVGVAIFSAVVLSSGSSNYIVGCACPPAWGAGYESRVLPGETGCQGPRNETCYAFLLISNVASVRLSGLRFELIGPPWNNTSMLNGTPVVLGPNALVSVLNSTGVQVGSWDWNLSSWIQGGNWTIPVDVNVTLVLDTGLQDAHLSGDWFWTFMVDPNYGATETVLP